MDDLVEVKPTLNKSLVDRLANSKEVRRLARHYGVNYINKSYLEPLGVYVRERKLIVLSTRILFNREQAMMTFFHELGHWHCVENGLWVSYHNDITHISGLRAERWVDRWAAKEMYKWYPEIRYSYPYSNDYQIKWFKNHIKHIQLKRHKHGHKLAR